MHTLNKPFKKIGSRGRPVIPGGKKGRVRAFYLDDLTVDLATEAGNGNASAGFRLLAAIYEKYRLLF